jgi:hypothetical protein
MTMMIMIHFGNKWEVHKHEFIMQRKSSSLDDQFSNTFSEYCNVVEGVYEQWYWQSDKGLCCSQHSLPFLRSHLCACRPPPLPRPLHAHHGLSFFCRLHRCPPCLEVTTQTSNPCPLREITSRNWYPSSYSRKNIIWTVVWSSSWSQDTEFVLRSLSFHMSSRNSFYFIGRIRRFIAVSWAKLNWWTTTHFLSLRSIVILCYHLHLGLASELLHFRFYDQNQDLIKFFLLHIWTPCWFDVSSTAEWTTNGEVPRSIFFSSFRLTSFLLFVHVFLLLSMYTYCFYVFLDAATLTGFSVLFPQL